MRDRIADVKHSDDTYKFVAVQSLIDSNDLTTALDVAVSIGKKSWYRKESISMVQAHMAAYDCVNNKIDRALEIVDKIETQNYKDFVLSEIVLQQYERGEKSEAIENLNRIEDQDDKDFCIDFIRKHMNKNFNK